MLQLLEKDRKMDIFTDASLNDKKKIAGVSAIFMPSQSSGTITSYNSYCSVNKIETAELLAIAMALSLIKPDSDKNIRIHSDSVGALRKIQRIFHHPDQKQIHTIKDSMQKQILYNMSFSFSKVYDLDFSFWYVHGHQHKVDTPSDAYYNSLADQQALIGRMDGELIHQQEKEHNTGVSSLSAEERIILNQQSCLIVSPNQISFHYEGLKPKVVAHKRSKNRFVRKVCKSARSPYA